MAKLVLISWREIPAQVTAREGRRTAKAILPLRFPMAIDKAATKAGKKDMDEYLAEWCRTERACGEDLEAEVAAEVARIEAEYPRARLAAPRGRVLRDQALGQDKIEFFGTHRNLLQSGQACCEGRIVTAAGRIVPPVVYFKTQ